MKPKSCNLLLAASSLIAVSSASAETLYWDGAGSAWGTAANWSTASGAATPNPANPAGALDDAIFNITTANGNITVGLDADQAAQSLTFNNTGGTTFRANLAADLTARTLSIGSGGIKMNAGAGAVTFGNNQGTNGHVNIALTAGQNWTNNSSTTLFLNNSTATALTGSADLGINGTGRVSITGLAGSTGYSGNITVSGGGELEARSTITTNGALGTGNMNVTGGNVGLYFGNTLTRAIGSGAGQIQFSSGVSGISGNGSSNSTFTISGMKWGEAEFNPTEFLFQNATANSNGQGALVANIDLNNGTRTIRSNQAVDSAYVGNGTITGNLTTSTGTAGLIKTGIGQITLNGTNTYTLGTAINQGTLRFNTLASMPATGNVSVADGSTLGVTATNNATTWGAGTGNGGIAGLINSGLGGQAGSTVTFAGNSSVLLNVTANFTESNALGNGTATNLSLIKVGGSNLTLSNQNTYTGTTTVGQGTLTLGHATNTLANAGAVTVTGTGTLALGANSDTVGAVTLVSGTISSTTGVLTASSVDLQNGTVSAILGGSGLVTKTTAGTVTLSGNNTNSGGFQLNDGIITGIGNGTYQGFGTGPVTINGGRMTFNSGANATIANNINWNANFVVDRSPSAAPTINWDGNITLGANVAMNGSAAGASYNQIFNGNIGQDIGGRSLTFNVSGTGGRQYVTLNGNNTFTGGLSIQRGSLTIGGTGNLGAGDYSGNISITSTSDGGITYSSSSDQILRGVISGASGLSLTKDTSTTSTLTLTNTSTYNGATTVNAGKLTIASTGNINATSGVSIGAGEFNYNSSTALTKAVTFSGTDGTLSGNGTINSAVNVTTGNTLSVGNSPGQMNFANTLGLAGTTIMEIDGDAGAGLTGGHDFVNLTGAGAAGVLTYGGLMTLDIGTIFGEGVYSWDLFDMASETSTFSTIALADQYSGNLLDGDSNGIWDLTSGNDTWQFTESSGVLSLTVAVPEPSAALLGVLGCLLLLRRRR